MILRITIFLFLSFLLFDSCTSEKDFIDQTLSDQLTPENRLSDYIQHPNKQDSLCIKDLDKAEKDIAKGHISFCEPFGFGTFPMRQEKYLKQLCEKHHIYFKYELFSDVIIEGQTQGCYGTYMDEILKEKFGNDFKEKLKKQADSLLSISNDTIDYYLCDERPQIHGDGRVEINMEVFIDRKIYKKLDSCETTPFMDIGFYVNKLGEASGYSSSKLLGCPEDIDSKIENLVFKAALLKIKELKKWEPGVVNGQKINATNNIRVYFLPVP